MNDSELMIQCHNKMIEALAYIADNQWRISRNMEAFYDGSDIEGCRVKEE